MISPIGISKYSDYRISWEMIKKLAIGIYNISIEMDIPVDENNVPYSYNISVSEWYMKNVNRRYCDSQAIYTGKISHVDLRYLLGLYCEAGILDFGKLYVIGERE